MTASMWRVLLPWTTLVPVAALVALLASWGRTLPPLVLAIEAVLLVGAVMAAVHHAETIAHRIGEPFGSLVLAVAVTVIEVGLIVMLMVSGSGDTSTLARDTVFAAVMITMNGIVGLSLMVGALKYRMAVFHPEGTGSALATVMALAVLTLVLPHFTTSNPGAVYTTSQLAFAAVVSLALYGSSVFTQTIRHRDFFLPPHEVAHAEGVANPEPEPGSSGSLALAPGSAHPDSPSVRSALRVVESIRRDEPRLTSSSLTARPDSGPSGTETPDSPAATTTVGPYAASDEPPAAPAPPADEMADSDGTPATTTVGPYAGPRARPADGAGLHQDAPPEDTTEDEDDEGPHAHRPTSQQALISLALLLVALVAVVGLAKTESPAIEFGLRWFGLPSSFVGVVLAMVVLLPETIAAVRAAAQNRTQISLNLGYGSAMASIGLTIPTMAVASYWLPGTLTLGLDNVQIVLLVSSGVVSVLTVVPGRAKTLHAVVLLCILAAFIFFSVVP